MPLLNDDSFQDWKNFVLRVDEHVARAITSYQCDRQYTTYDIVAAFNELSKLARSQESDYNKRAMALAYSLTYLPRKVCMIAAVLSKILARDYRPTRVLDIGSGTGASTLALSLLYNDSTLEIIEIEPSQEMQDFCEYLPIPDSINRSPVEGCLEELVANRVYVPQGSCDLIILSSCLQPSHERLNSGWWSTLSEAITRLASKTAMVVSIEPDVKSRLSRLLFEAMQGFQWDFFLQTSSSSLTESVRRKVILPETTRITRDLYRATYRAGLGELLDRRYISNFPDDQIVVDESGAMIPGPYPVSSWNSTPSYWESIIVFGRESDSRLKLEWP
jgi:SAM-dependent methyltransferase